MMIRGRKKEDEEQRVEERTILSLVSLIHKVLEKISYTLYIGTHFDTFKVNLIAFNMKSPFNGTFYERIPGTVFCEDLQDFWARLPGFSCCRPPKYFLVVVVFGWKAF